MAANYHTSMYFGYQNFGRSRVNFGDTLAIPVFRATINNFIHTMKHNTSSEFRLNWFFSITPTILDVIR